jgi:hypothetical protein
MFRDPYRCEECGAPVDECSRVEEFRVYIQEDVISRRIRWYCAPCAEAYARRQAYGQIDGQVLQLASQLLESHYNAPVVVRGLQEDWLSVQVLVQRLPPPETS